MPLSLVLISTLMIFKSLFVFAGWFLLPLLAQGQSAQTIFVYERDIHFDENEVLFRLAGDLKVSPNGSILISDPSIPRAYRFDPDGKLLGVLDPGKCHPGSPFTPREFATSETRIFINSLVTGFYFDQEGDCLNDVGLVQSFLDLTLFAGDSLLIGIKDEPLTIEFFDTLGVKIRENVLPETEFPHADRRRKGGGLAATGVGIFFAPSVSPVIYRVRGEQIEIISRDRYFDAPVLERDWPQEFNPGLMSLGRPPSVENMFTLPGGQLLVQYLKDSDYLWLIVDPANLNNFIVMKSTFFLHDMQGEYGYRLIRNIDGSHPNPYVEVYRFVGTDRD